MIWENTHFRTVKYEYGDPDVPKEMDGLRILQLSDLHGQSYGRDNCRLLAAIRDCNPDVIMVTGDLIDSTFTNTEKALDFAEELVKLAPIYYCTGNHEHRLEEKELKTFLAELSARGVQVLSDEAVPFYGGVLAGLQERSSRQADALEKVLAEQDPKAFTLPSPAVKGDDLDFSFSGLKTAALNLINQAEQKGETISRADLAASYTHTIVEGIVKKTDLALKTKAKGVTTLVLAGGVAANSHIRSALSRLCEKHGVRFIVPDRHLCGDNAAMIAAAGYFEYQKGTRADTSLNASASDYV